MTKRQKAIIDLQFNDSRNGKELYRDQINKAIGNIRKSGIFYGITYKGDYIEFDHGGDEPDCISYDYIELVNYIHRLHVLFDDIFISRAWNEINFKTITSPVIIVDGNFSL